MCGILGIYSNKPVNKKLFFGLSSLQHRGQESCGITVSKDDSLKRVKGMGMVSEVFKEDNLSCLDGNIGIGHVRYSTDGGSYDYNTQPLMGFSKGEELSLAHNGDLINHQILRTRLEEEGMMFQTSIDSEVILFLIARYYNGDIVEAIKKTMSLIKGAYSVVLLLEDKLIAFRDNYGIRPLVMGESDEGDIIFSSENAPIEIMGAKVKRDILPGEIVVVDESGINSYFYENTQKPKHCIFEYVYFSRDDATLDKVNSYNFRRRCGEILSREAPCDVDLVVAVPDSGIPSAIGYAQETNIPFAEGLVKNRYVGRTFIKPTQEEREMAVKLKLNPLRHVVEGKRIALIDDSIVRGTTSRNLIKRIREAGAKEVHLRITSPPVINQCYYGIDTPSRMNLIAANHTIEEMRELIGADSLAFISIDGMQRATLIRDDRFCKACFDGNYPVDPIRI
ncbi:amidophosphoribosyltransferase [Peptoniphilus stercorisuis]|uniref:Amidophosphoribosyltransferase n=1 Tax=Peptoniphilus stercorisuis TaxID=1436965 RepID=A0ABS4KE44_9FIRM|nr:amidophosphoribosyltransferase [Peptoniphilus stercorisuis]MBP2026027.1 amidophosphoribosyltransferase [Peptoniphilus stercorisuis]